jgi:hypothetical protein
VGEPLEAQVVLLPELHPFHLAVQDAGGGDRGHPHAVAEEEDDVLRLAPVRLDAGVEVHLGPAAGEEGLLGLDG